MAQSAPHRAPRFLGPVAGFRKGGDRPPAHPCASSPPHLLAVPRRRGGCHESGSRTRLPHLVPPRRFGASVRRLRARPVGPPRTPARRMPPPPATTLGHAGRPRGSLRMNTKLIGDLIGLRYKLMWA